jgi:uncharacterized membrane protein
MATRSLPTALAFALLCAAGASAQEMPRDVTASGNEPFWRVVIEAGDFTLTRPDFQPLILSVTERRTQADGTFVIVSASSSPALRAVLSLGPGPCNDTMADQTYPFTATVALGDNVLTGCGGDPRDLLTASEVWTVTEIAGAAPVEGTEVEIAFSPDGGLSGTGGCNRINALLRDHRRRSVHRARGQHDDGLPGRGDGAGDGGHRGAGGGVFVRHRGRWRDFDGSRGTGDPGKRRPVVPTVSPLRLAPMMVCG